MADEFSVHAAGAVELGFEGEDDEHAIDEALHPAQTAALPCPELWADEPKDGDAKALAVHSKAEVHVGEVDEDGEIWRRVLDHGDECAILRVDKSCVADHFSEAHVRDIFGTDDAFEACVGHAGSAEASEAGGRDAVAKFGYDLCAVVIARGFASGEEDTRVGVVGDEDKFSLSIWRSWLAVRIQALGGW